MICSVSWYLTALSLLITNATSLIYYSGRFHFTDTSTITLVSVIMCLIVFMVYVNEKKVKAMFIQMAQIQLLNEELRAILNNLPEGIILIDDAT